MDIKRMIPVKIMGTGLILITLILLVGCTSRFDKFEKRIIGENMDRITGEWGAADTTGELSDGRSVHTYKTKNCKINFIVDANNIVLKINRRGSC